MGDFANAHVLAFGPIDRLIEFNSPVAILSGYGAHALILRRLAANVADCSRFFAAQNIGQARRWYNFRVKIVYITSGAGGMYCGSCMRDNTLVAALCKLGHEALLVPTYTPIRTDEEDVSKPRMFFGGLNVYLQQKSSLFRYTPWFFDRLLDGWLLRRAARGSVNVQAQELADLTLSMLDGSHGKQRKEVEKLAAALAEEFRPDTVVMSNILLSGLVPTVRKRWHGPVLATLQGDDIFLEQLPAPARDAALERIRSNCQYIDGYFATCRYYADFMADYAGLPRDRIHVVYPGLNLSGFPEPTERQANEPLTIGYFARIAPEKGLHVLAQAFVRLRQMPDVPRCRLRFAGWLGKHNEPYLAEVRNTLSAVPAEDVEQLDCPDRESKLRFLQSIDLFSVPGPYREPKGLYVLEALACGVPVVQPRHGSFPELIEATGGGLLFEPGNPDALAEELKRLLLDADLRRRLGRQGQQAVRERFTAERMATETMAVLEQYKGKVKT